MGNLEGGDSGNSGADLDRVEEWNAKAPAADALETHNPEATLNTAEEKYTDEIHKWFDENTNNFDSSALENKLTSIATDYAVSLGATEEQLVKVRQMIDESLEVDESNDDEIRAGRVTFGFNELFSYEGQSDGYQTEIVPGSFDTGMYFLLRNVDDIVRA